MKYLDTKGTYSPELLIVDSPILSLKEPGDERAPDKMKSGLFRYMMEHHSFIFLMFTKNDSEGRYGFLMDIRRNN